MLTQVHSHEYVVSFVILCDLRDPSSRCDMVTNAHNGSQTYKNTKVKLINK